MTIRSSRLRFREAVFCFFAAALLFAAHFPAHAVEPNLEGVGGLINTPLAEAIPDGALSFGFGINKNIASPRFGFTQYNHYFALGFLPGFEVTGRLTRFPDFEDPAVPRFGDYKDREVSVKWQFLKESDAMPAVAVGVRDMGGEARTQEAFYAVAQKRIYKNLTLSVGGGTDKYEGVFGGALYNPVDSVELMAEYDTEGLNAGVRFTPADWLSLSLAALDGGDVGFSVNTKINLNKLKSGETKPANVPLVRWDSRSQANPRMLAERLVENGYENVSAFVQDGELVVFYENRMHVLEESALGAVAAIAAMHAPAEVNSIRVVAQIDGVPHLDFTSPPDEILKFMRGEISESDLTAVSSASYHRGVSREADSTGVFGSSRFKTDLFLRPGLDFVAGEAYAPFKQRIAVLLDPEVKLGKGLFAAGRASYTFNNNLSDIDGFELERGFLGFGGRSGGLSWLAKGGLLGIDLYGAQLEAEYDFEGMGASLGGNVAVLEDSVFKFDYVQALGKVEKRFPKYDFSARVFAGQFQFEDTGVRAEATRYFGPVEITFFGYDTDRGATEGGFAFWVPLPFYDGSPPERVRFGVAPEWGFMYRTDEFANGAVLTAGRELRRYRRRLEPDYVMAHLDGLRKGAALIK